MIRRGRPPKTGRGPGRPAKNSKAEIKVGTLNFPVTKEDEKPVECKKCGEKMTLRQFRIHNITQHYNLAVTTDDETECDHNFFARKLKELSRLMKIAVYTCPNEDCEQTYKSALGLGYHLMACGRAEEEIVANSVECEICGKLCLVSNINWHRRLHDKPKKEFRSPPVLHGKRQSAKKARAILRKVKDESDNEDGDHENGNESGSDAYEPDRTAEDDENQDMDVDETETEEYEPAGISEIAAFALRRLRPLRKNVQVPAKSNILDYLLANPLQQLKPAEAYQCLPGSLVSHNLKVSARGPKSARNVPPKYTATSFHRLKIFESEVADFQHGINLVYCGGPVSSIAWNSTGTFMAASTLRDIENPPLFCDLQSSPCTIQVYRNLYLPPTAGSTLTEANGLELKFVMGILNGYVHHLLWSSYSELKDVNIDAGVEASEVVAHIAYAAGDASIGILVLTNEIFHAPNCFLVPDNSKRSIPFYKKAPEMKLTLFEANAEPGQCTRFDWSSSMEYIAAGYGNGLLAVFNLKKVSRLLNKTVVDEDFNKTVELKPVWVFQAHTEVISVVQFCADDSNFLMTGSHDYSLKFWDIRMRSELECKKLGMIIDANWLEKWTHVAVSLEFCNLAIQIASGTMVKFLPVGSSKGVTNICHPLNVTSLAFHKGMIAEATEIGNIVVSYYDSYSRECDYDRNKRKQNAVNFSSAKTEDIPESDEVGVCFTFDFDRKEASSISTEPSKKHVKDLTLHYHKLRINKISWCPTGKQMAVAYQNGCLVVVPVTFEKLYGRQTWTPPQ